MMDDGWWCLMMLGDGGQFKVHGEKNNSNNQVGDGFENLDR